MGIKEIIASEFNGLCDKMLKRTALQNLINTLEEMEQTLILGVEDLQRTQTGDDDVAKRMRLSKAQIKIDMIRQSISEGNAALADLDLKLAEFAVV